MSTTPPVSGDAPSPPPAPVNPKGSMGKDDFLQAARRPAAAPGPAQPDGEQGLHGPDGPVLLARADDQRLGRDRPAHLRRPARPERRPDRPHRRLRRAEDGTARRPAPPPRSRSSTARSRSRSATTASAPTRCGSSPNPARPSPEPHDRNQVPRMMRGMFAAISGLKAHQVMLDVAANDIANVNTVGYKGERTSFKEALSQLQQRRERRRHDARRHERRRRSASASSSTRSTTRWTSGAIQSTGNPFDLAIQGDGWFQVTDDPTGFSRSLLHARRQLQPRRQRRPRDPGGLLRRRQDGRRRRTRRSPIPATIDSVSVGQDGAVTTVDRRRRRRTVATLSLAKFPNDQGLERASGNRFVASSELRHADRRRPRRHRPRPDHAGRGRDVERRPRPGVHEHDHRPARLPGQQPRDLGRRRDAPGARQPEALTRRTGGGRRSAAAPPPTLSQGDDTVIPVHRLTHPDAPVWLNPDLIQQIEATPGHRDLAHERDAAPRRRGRPPRSSSSSATGAPASSRRARRTTTPAIAGRQVAPEPSVTEVRP